jgi:Tol biopolymer transport system component
MTMRTIRPPTLAAILSVAFAAAIPFGALAQSAPEPIRPSTSTVLVSGGTGNQTDPHISGVVLTYTSIVETSSEIRYHDATTGEDAAIPNQGNRDSLAGISGSTVVFRRVHTDAITTAREIMAFDITTPGVAPRALAQDATARRAFLAIGGTTVAWMEFVESSSTQSEIVAYDLATEAVTRLTDDAMSNRDPAVSEDGSVITWVKCQADGTLCDLWHSTRSADGTWSVAKQLTAGPSEEILPDTNGEQIVFASDSAGDWNIEWMSADGTDHRQLLMEGTETNPNIDGTLVSFEHEVAGSTNADLFVYDLSTGQLYQVTDTPAVDETLNDISVAADGTVRIVAASPDGLSVGHNDIYLHTFRLEAAGPSYEVCPLFDVAKAHRVGSTVPIKLQLCDATGANLSSASVSLTATGLVKQDSTATTALAEDSGNANPDSAFRYDADLAGYAYNLSTRGLSRGTWELRFQVTGDPNAYAVTFDLR